MSRRGRAIRRAENGEPVDSRPHLVLGGGRYDAERGRDRDVARGMPAVSWDSDRVADTVAAQRAREAARRRG